MSLKMKLLVAAALSVAAAGLGPTTAMAGEVTGNGQRVTINANSECAFSGLEDWVGPTAQPPGGTNVVPGVTQNWGQIPKAVRDFLASTGVSPGALCNAHLNPLK